MFSYPYFVYAWLFVLVEEILEMLVKQSIRIGN